MKTHSPHRILAGALVVALFILTLNASAATKLWTGGGADDYWITGPNWQDGSPPASADDLVFGSAARQANTNNLAGLSLGAIGFTTGGFALAGNAITLANGLTNEAGNNVFNINLTLGADQSFLNSAPGSTLAVGAGIDNSGRLLTLNGAGDLGFAAALSGAGGLTKDGSGTATVSGANTYRGATLVNNGTLRLQMPQAFTNALPALPSPELWLDGADASTLFMDAAGTLPVTASGDVVLRWNDKSGNNNHATLSGVQTGPSYLTGVLAGQSVVRFNAVNNGMTTPLVVSGGDLGIFVVYSYRSSTSAGRRAIQGQNNWLIGPYNNQYQVFAGGFVAGAPAVVQNQFVLHAAVESAGTVVNYVNGGSHGTRSGSTYPGRIYLAYATGNPPFGEPLDGDIAEVLVYNVPLTTDQRLIVEAYLRNKWLGGSSSPVVWLDAADPGAVLTNATGQVTNWMNKGSLGAAGDATQPTAANAPALVAGGLNSQPVLRFNGSSTYLSNSYANPWGQITLLAMLRRNAVLTANPGPMGFNQAASVDYNNVQSMVIYEGGGGSPNITLHRNATTGQYSPHPGNDNPYIMVATIDGFRGHIHVNGVSGATTNASTGMFNIQKACFGNRFSAAGGTLGADWWAGDMAEVLLYNRALTTTERQNLESYLRSKWLGSPLPVTTPVTVAAGARLDLNGVNQIVGSIAGAGLITNSSGTAARLTVNTTTSNDFSGSIGGALSLLHSGPGVTMLSGSSPNTHSGPTIVANGTMYLAKSVGVPAIVGPVQMGTGSATQPHLRMNANAQFDPSAVMTFLNASGNWMRFDLQNTTQTLAGIQCTTGGGVIQNERFGGGGTIGPATLIISNNADYSFTGYIRDRDGGDGTYPLSFVKDGTALQELTGNQIRYTGPTTVRAGTLRLNNAPTFQSPMLIPAGSTGVVTTANAAVDNWVYAKALTGTGTLVKEGTGWFQVQQIAPRDFAGTILIKQGRLGSGMNNTDWSNSRADVILSSGAQLDVRTDDMTLDELSGDGEVWNTYNIEGVNTLTIGVDNGSSTFNGVIRGYGGGANNTSPDASRIALNKVGTGTFTLGGLNTYAGNTTLRSGTLALGAGGSISNSPTITVDAGTLFDVTAVTGGYQLHPNQTLAGSGAVAGNVSVLGNAALNPGGSFLPATLSFSNNLGFAAGTAVSIFDLTTDTTMGSGINDLIEVAGDLNPGGASLAVNALGQLDIASPYRLIHYAGSKTGAFGGVTHQTRYTFAIDESEAGYIKLNVSGSSAYLTWSGGGANNWDVNLSTNWENNTEKFFNSDTVGFTDTSSNLTVNLVQTVFPGGITVNSTNTYVFQGVGRISGSTGLDKDGPGTLALNTANDFIGPILIIDGVVKPGHSAALGATNGGTVITGTGALDVNGLNLGFEPVSVQGAGQGGGAIINTGADQYTALQRVTLDGDTTFGGINRWDIGRGGAGLLQGNGFTLTKVGPNIVDLLYLGETALGDINVDGGTLYFEDDTTMGDPLKTCTVNNGATLAFWATTTNLNKPVVVNSGIINNGAGSTVHNGPFTLNTNVPFDISGASMTLNSAVGGPGALTKRQGGLLVLGGSNTYPGGTFVLGGTLQIGASPTGSVLGPVFVTNASLVLNRSDDVNLTDVIADGTVAGTGHSLVINGGGTLEFNGGSVDGGAIRVGSGSAGRFLHSAGTLPALSLAVGHGNNPTNPAEATITGGELNLTGAGTDDGVEIARFRQGSETSAWGRFSLNSGAVFTHQVAFGSSGVSPNYTGYGEFNLNGGTLHLGAGGLKKFEQFFAPYAVNLSGGTIVARADWSSSLNITLATGPGVTIQAADTNGTPHDVSLSGVLSGPGSLTKTGGGTLALSNAHNAYTGPTILNEGMIRILPAPAVPLPGSDLWLDAADLATVQTNVSGQVTAWLNKGAAGALGDAAPPAPANAPVFLASSLNGRPVLTFANGQYLTNNLTNATDKLTVFIVLKRTAVPSDYPGPLSFLAPGRTDHDNALSFAVYDDQVGAACKLHRNSGNVATFTPHPGNNVAFLQGLMFDGANAYVFVNGVAGSHVGGTSGNFDIQRMSIGMRLDGAGGTPGVTGKWAGDIAELLVYSRVLSSSERRAVEDYLNFKWLGLGAGRDILPIVSSLSIATGATFDLNGLPQAVGSLAGAGGVTNSSATAAALTVGNDSSNTVFTGVISGPSALTKVGSGSLTLVTAQSYSGNTTVSNGVLLVNADLGSGSGAVTVAGGFLGGTGPILDALTVLPGGTLAPGISIGTLTVSNDVTLGGEVVMELNKSGATLSSDLLRGVSALTYGGTLTVLASGDPVTGGETFDLFDANLFTGSFSATNLPPLSGLSWDLSNLTVDGTIYVNQAPIPTNTNLNTTKNRAVILAATAILQRCSDPEGDALAIAAVSNSTNGALVTLVGDDITYTPVTDFVGADRFTYTLRDSRGGTAQGYVFVDVYPGNIAGLNIVSIEPVGANYLFRFAGIPGRNYTIERALEVTGPWTNIANVPASSVGITDFTDTNAPSGQAFYRTVHP